MPLDLGPEELLGGDKLQDAVNALDQDGWSTRGRLHPATMLRLKLSSAFMIEEIVNIALSQSPCSTLGQLEYVTQIPPCFHVNKASQITNEESSELKLRQLESIKGVPEILKYDPKRLDDPGSDMVTFYASILIYLTHLQNAFFIERLRLSYGAADDGDLLITSFDLVSVTMALWTHKDRFLEMRRNFEWLVRDSASTKAVRKADHSVADSLRGSGRRNTLSGAAPANCLRWRPPKGLAHHALKDRPAVESSYRISRLGSAFGAQ